MTTTVNHKAWRDHLPGDLDELAELRRRAMAAGHSNAVVIAFVGWAWGEMSADEPRMVLSTATAAKYRKVLRELTIDPLDGPPTTKRRRARADRGAGHAPRSRRQLVGAAAGAALGVAGALTGNLALLAAGPPVILDPRVTSTSEPELGELAA